MALEKNLFAIAPRLFSADGGLDGKVTVQSTCDFKVKQKVKVSGNGLDPLDLEVKRIISETEMFLGPVSGPISDRVDLSAYTTAASSFIFAIEQKRPSIPFEELTRAVYEEEPTVAYRNVLVDKLGRFYSEDNRLPVRSGSDATSKLMANLLAVQVNTDIDSSQFIVNNDNFFIYDNDGDFIKEG